MLRTIYNYTINFKNNQYYSKILWFLLFSFILSLFFPVRHVFLTSEAYLAGQYSDFTSFSLYLSDIIFFTTWFFIILPRGGEIWLKIKSIISLGQKSNCTVLLVILLFFWLILGLIFNFSNISAYHTLKWTELIVAYGTVKLVLSDKRLENWIGQGLANFFVGFSTIQSILALLQFYKQTSLGLYRLGESHIAPNITGVAKLAVNSEIYIRGYGTFPHPNVLAVFLLIAIFFGVYKLINSERKAQIYWAIITFLNILGLTVTFSRAAYLGLALGLILFFLFLLIKLKNNGFWIKSTTAIIVIILSVVFSSFLFYPYLFSRASIKDNAYFERVEYNSIALKIIKAKPIIGVGAGEGVLHMEPYSQKTLQPWQKQPIHNYFLLSAAELGIPAALILIGIFLCHLKSIIYKLKSSKEFQFTAYFLLLTTILFVFLILMFFDHYFYTLQQSQMLLWVFLGIIAAKNEL